MVIANIVNQGFVEALERLKSQRLPMKVAFNLISISKKVKEELAAFEEARKSSLVRLADKDDSGNPIIEDNRYKLSNEAIELFNKELSDLYSTEVNIPAIKVSDLGDISDIKMSTQDLELLEPILDMD